MPNLCRYFLKYHVAPSCWNQTLPISSSSVFVNKNSFNGPITIAIDCNGFSLLIFEEKLPNYDSGPNSAPNSDSFWVRTGFLCPKCNNLAYIPAMIKMSFIWKDDFFLPKSGSSVNMLTECTYVWQVLYLKFFSILTICVFIEQ